MAKVPSAVWIVDTKKEHLAVDEARKLGLPVIAILDTNCDPDEVDYKIPGNDDAIRSVTLLTRVIADAVADGLMARSAAVSARPPRRVSSRPTSRWPSGSASSCPVRPRVLPRPPAPPTPLPPPRLRPRPLEAPAADATVAEAPAADAPAADATAAEAPAADAPAAETPAADAQA